MCIPGVPGAGGGQKGASNPLQPELEMAVSCLVDETKFSSV